MKEIKLVRDSHTPASKSAIRNSPTITSGDDPQALLEALISVLNHDKIDIENNYLTIVDSNELKWSWRAWGETITIGYSDATEDRMIIRINSNGNTIEGIPSTRDRSLAIGIVAYLNGNEEALKHEVPQEDEQPEEPITDKSNFFCVWLDTSATNNGTCIEFHGIDFFLDLNKGYSNYDKRQIKCLNIGAFYRVDHCHYVLRLKDNWPHHTDIK